MNEQERQLSSTTGDELAVSRPSVVAGHWRGEYSLATSFWVSCVLVTLAQLLLLVLLPRVVGVQLSELPVGARLWFGVGSLLIYLALIATNAWQLVGLWRASRREWTNNRKRISPIVSLGVMALWVTLFQTVAYRLGEASLNLLGSDEMGSYTVSVSSNGERITIVGPITYALPAQMEELLRDNPNVRLVQLSGPGGRKGPARQLARIIREHNLSTFVDDTCNSACAEVFLSGRERILGQNGKLGFHRSEPYRSETMNRQEEEESRQYYLQVGLTEEFIDRVLATAYEEIWMPKVDEVLKAGVVTHTK